jgi:hypothetical protein
VFVQVLVVHFMRAPDGCEIAVLTVPEKPETLVNKNIMHQEIGKSINGNTKADEEQEIITVLHSDKKADDTGNGKDQEEEIVVLEESLRLLVVMVFVQNPQNAMHDVFMRKPGYGFHRDEGCQCDQYFSNYHNSTLSYLFSRN